ncbi:Pimeloyl-ACP methyl ester carboxylesterase [Thiothrix eikelboomii]|uniref:Pimeloyl-ACP methyl ester carboxylesterase n=1 Tax=Thiothrix eikelboomii TaxID=92487 RepID=A0A1T4VZL4_9GAMM|nr:alpha/beta hydrolase [Thiothrix eikelboomii]SKA70464.1 Pimeloyl-ACP methyl ester carboxylesterase [Thiothrix eikelboomii]
MDRPIEFFRLDWCGRAVQLEYQWVGRADSQAPLVVFLHEGLGSVSMWKDFPARFCQAAHCRGLVYSRPGYGQSTPRHPDERWGVDFMHRQAFEVLPALLAALKIDPRQQQLWLFGHSDGASISLLYAARYPQALAGAIVLAPHIMVEDITIISIEQARDTYQTTDLPKKLSRYHQDVDSAFWGWNTIWLHPPFRAWSIEEELTTIQCPLLAVQGLDDEYGSLEQIRGLARRVPSTELLELPACGHSPHRDQPTTLITNASDFISRHTLGGEPR